MRNFILRTEEKIKNLVSSIILFLKPDSYSKIELTLCTKFYKVKNNKVKALLLEGGPTKFDISFLKLLLLGYFNWTSIEGKKFQLGVIIRDTMIRVYNYQSAKIFHEFIFYVDLALWPFWFLLTTYEMRIEYFKQIFFLHYFKGNLIVMYQFGLFNDMYQEWIYKPITIRKWPTYYYIEWHWKSDWHAVWRKLSARLRYRMAVFYRLREGFLLPGGFNNRWLSPYVYVELAKNRYKPVANYYYQSQINKSIYAYFYVVTLRLRSNFVLAYKKYVRMAKFVDRLELIWKKKSKGGTLETFKGRTILRDSRPQKDRYLSSLKSFNKISKQRNYYNPWIITSINDYNYEQKLIDYDFIDPNPLNIPIMDDYAFFRDSYDFEDQQDDDDDEMDESFNYDYNFGIHGHSRVLGYRYSSDDDDKIYRKGLRKMRRTKKWRHYSTYKRTAKRHHKAFHDEFIVFNERGSTLLDGDRLSNPGDGPNIPEDEYLDLESGFGYHPRRIFKILDWYWFKNDNSKFTERRPMSGHIGHWFLWNKSQHVRFADDLTIQTLRNIKQFNSNWIPNGKRRHQRLRYKASARHRRYIFKYRKLWNYRRIDKLTKRKWQNFLDRPIWLWNVHSKILPTYEKQSFKVRYFERLSQRHESLFLIRHKSHLEVEGYKFKVQTSNFSKLSYFKLLASQFTNNKLAKKVITKKIFGSKTKAYKDLNFHKKLNDKNYHSKFAPKLRYNNNRPIPRRVAPNQHYEKYPLTFAHDLPSAGCLLVILFLIVSDPIFTSYDLEVHPIDLFFNPQREVYLWWNFTNPDWFTQSWSQFEFIKTDHLLPRDGYQKHRYPFKIWDDPWPRWRNGMFGRFRSNHYASFLTYERFALWRPSMAVQFLSGKGFKDWIIPMNNANVVDYIRWVRYYSPIEPRVGDRWYWLANFRTNSRDEYLMNTPTRRHIWRLYITNETFTKLWYHLQHQRLDYMNTWNVTLFQNYTFVNPREIFGASPVRLEARSEHFYKEFLRNHIYSNRAMLKRHFKHFLGYDQYFTFSRRSRRFHKWFYNNQLPLWETYINSVCIQEWRTQAMQNPIAGKPCESVHTTYVTWFKPILDQVNSVLIEIWYVWVYALRVFLLFGGPTFFMKNFRDHHLYRLSFKFLIDSLPIAPVQRQVGKIEKVQIIEKDLLFNQPIKKKSRQSLWPHEKKEKFYKRYIRVGSDPTKYEIEDPLHPINPKNKNPIYKSKWKTRINSGLGLIKIINKNRLNRRLNSGYSKIYHRTVYRGRVKLRNRYPEFYHNSRAIQTGWWGGIRRQKKRYFHHRKLPTLKNSFKFDFKSANIQRSRPKTKPQPLFIRNSSVLNYSLFNSVEFRKFNHLCLLSKRRRQLLRPTKNQKCSNFWLVHPKEKTITFRLSFEPNRSEFMRRTSARRRKHKRRFKMFMDDPTIQLEDYFGYHFVINRWLRKERIFRKKKHFGRNTRNIRREYTGRIDYNLKFKNQLKNKINYMPNLKNQLETIPDWAAKQIQHRYHLNRYHQSINSLPLCSPTPVETSTIYDQFLIELFKTKYPNQTVLGEIQELPLIAGETDFSDPDDDTHEGDDGDEDEGELMIYENDSLFDEFENTVLETNLNCTIRDRLYTTNEERQRQLLISYKRFRSLPLEHYSLNVPVHVFDEDEGELYWGVYSVDHPAYEQLCLTVYDQPKLHRWLSKIDKIKKNKKLKVNFKSRLYRRFWFKWVKPERSKVFKNHLSTRIKRNLIKPKKQSLWRPQKSIPMDWPVFHPWMSMIDDIWPLDWQTKDYLYSLGSSFVTEVVDEDSVSLFDHLCFNVGYRWSSEQLYSLILLRPIEADQSCIEGCYNFESGLNYYNNLIPEDLNYESIIDHESFFLEWLCFTYYEGHNFFSHNYEINQDLHLEDFRTDEQDDDDEDDLSEIDESDSNLPHFLPLYALTHTVGQTDMFSLYKRLNNQSFTFINEGYTRIPIRKMRRYYHRKPYDKFSYQRNGWWQYVDPIFGWPLTKHTNLLARKPIFHLHIMMQHGVDYNSLDLTNNRISENILKIWALTETYYSDTPHGYCLDY